MYRTEHVVCRNTRDNHSPNSLHQSTAGENVLPVTTSELNSEHAHLHLLLQALNSSGLLQQVRQLAALSLQIRVPADMLVVDEDVRDGALVGDFLQRILDGRSIIWYQCPSAIGTTRKPTTSS